MKLEVWCLLASLAVCSCEKWSWPERAGSVKIDTKVKFIDTDRADHHHGTHFQDELTPFQRATDTEGFYNRPQNSGRFPVVVAAEQIPDDPYHSGNRDSSTFCRCELSATCNGRSYTQHTCGHGKTLCCYNRQEFSKNSEVLNEIIDDRAVLLPGQGELARPFPPPPYKDLTQSFHAGHEPEPAVLGSGSDEILVGPGGPTGAIGPNRHKQVLTGPNGPTGILGPHHHDSLHQHEYKADGSAQRGVLVGPGGPTGVIGPNYARRPTLIGPGGPTGMIGPRGPGYRRPNNPGILVGPGGPTGIIGPGRQILVGPRGPTGAIGPQGYFGK